MDFWVVILVECLVFVGLVLGIIFALKNPTNRQRMKLVFKKTWKIVLLILIVGGIISTFIGIYSCIDKSIAFAISIKQK